MSKIRRRNVNLDVAWAETGFCGDYRERRNNVDYEAHGRLFDSAARWVQCDAPKVRY